MPDKYPFVDCSVCLFFSAVRHRLYRNSTGDTERSKWRTMESINSVRTVGDDFGKD